MNSEWCSNGVRQLACVAKTHRRRSRQTTQAVHRRGTSAARYRVFVRRPHRSSFAHRRAENGCARKTPCEGRCRGCVCRYDRGACRGRGSNTGELVGSNAASRSSCVLSGVSGPRVVFGHTRAVARRVPGFRRSEFCEQRLACASPRARQLPAYPGRPPQPVANRSP